MKIANENKSQKKKTKINRTVENYSALDQGTTNTAMSLFQQYHSAARSRRIHPQLTYSIIDIVPFLQSALLNNSTRTYIGNSSNVIEMRYEKAPTTMISTVIQLSTFVSG